MDVSAESFVFTLFPIINQNKAKIILQQISISIVWKLLIAYYKASIKNKCYLIST